MYKKLLCCAPKWCTPRSPLSCTVYPSSTLLNVPSSPTLLNAPPSSTLRNAPPSSSTLINAPPSSSFLNAPSKLPRASSSKLLSASVSSTLPYTVPTTFFHTSPYMFHNSSSTPDTASSMPHTSSSTPLQSPSSCPATNATGKKDNTNVMPFEAIPGPRSLPVIGTLHHYLPIIGQYSLSRLHRTGHRKLRQFGPIVRERFMRGVNILYLFDPEDIEVMYAQEGRYPMRRSHTALEKYRLDRPHMYNTGGLLPTNGERWWEIRRRAQRVLSRVASVQSRLPHVDKVCQDFAKLITNIRCPKTGQVEDFLDLERRLFLELTMVATLDVRLGCFSSTSSSAGSREAEELMQAAHTSNSTILGTDMGLPLWRYFDTPLYRKLVKGQDTIYRIALKYVEAKEKELREGLRRDKAAPLSVLEYFLVESDLDKKDIVGIFCDTLLAGIDTGAFTLSYALYHLACNPDKQDIVAREAKELLDLSRGQVTMEVISKARYLKAALRETYRLRPVSIGVGRITQEDTVIRGYRIPKGTVVVTQNQVSCRLPEYFPDPNAFLPERWFNRRHTTTTSSPDSTFSLDSTSSSPHPYLVLPFGHGPRACIGRRMAEQNLYSAILQLVWRYHVGWVGGELDCISNLINEPDAPLTFTFDSRQ